MNASSQALSIPAQGRAAFPSPTTLLRTGVLVGLLLLIYWDTVRHLLIERWLTDGNWSHGWLIPLLSLYFLHSRSHELKRCEIRPSYVGAVVVALSLALNFVAAWRFQMAYPQAVSPVGVIFGLTLLLGGWNLIRLTWFPILFLLLAVPLPDPVYVELTMPLRRWASQAAATLLPVIVPGLHTEAQAVVIDYVLPGRPPGTLNVEDACSGMRLMMAFVTLGVAMAYLRNRPWWQRAIMVASCVPIALICNTFRVTTTGLLHIFGHAQPGWLSAMGVTRVGELAQGTPHQVLGILTLLIAMGLYALIGYVLANLFVDAEEDSTPAAA